MIALGETAAFEGFGAAAIAFVVVSHFIGFFIRGAFGFGSNMPIVLLTTWVLGPHHAILLVALSSGTAQIHLLPQGFRHTDWPIVRRLTVGILGGIALGVWVFAEVEPDWLVLLLGLLILSILAMDRLQVVERVQRAIDLRSRSLATLLAAISGTVGTVSGGGGLYFLVGYLKLVCPGAAVLRSTNVFLSGAFMIVRLMLLAIAGLFTPEMVLEALLISPAVVLGGWAGTRAFHRTSPERFYQALQLVLFAAALALFMKGLQYIL